MIKKILVFLFMICTACRAEEGMWLLTQIDRLPLHEVGFELSAEDIYDPEFASVSDAVAWLGGCTASFVSPDGLLITNHHCAYGAIQRASTPERNYLEDGFLASSRDEEIEAIGMNAYCLQEIRDVTDEILKAGEGVDDPVERDRKISAKRTALAEEIEAGRDDVHVRITSNYKGRLYLLYRYHKYQDLRLVYAPPKDVGKFGGEIDNWMWPRHTGDFTILRVYQGPEGSGAKYSPENIPVRPKQHLRIAGRPLREGDLTFILGFPGRTYRYRTSHSVAWNMHYGFPSRIENYTEIIALLDSVTRNDPAGELKITGLRSSFSNSKKNTEGQLESMRKGHFLQKKQNFEQAFRRFLQDNPNLDAAYGSILSEIDSLYGDYRSDREKRTALGLFSYASGVLPQIARDIVMTVKEREKPEQTRNPGFTERSVAKKLDRLHLRYFNYYPATDKAFLRYFLNGLLDLPAGQRVQSLSWLLPEGKSSVPGFADYAIENSGLGNIETAKSLYYVDSDSLRRIDDPLIRLALALYPDLDETGERSERFAARIKDLRKQYMSALLEWKGSDLYPDANSSMRLTYGHVAGYSPADGVYYTPFTTLSGVIDKDTGEWPFNVPTKLIRLQADKAYGRWRDPVLGDVPVNFLHRCDITGGNSGSPVMNAKGELVGLAFDGNWEALTGDWQYDYDIQRTISVDIRYVLFLIDKMAGSRYLLDELNL